MSRLLEKIAERLSDGGYQVERSVQLQDTTTADVTASRTYFSWKGLVILSQQSRVPMAAPFQASLPLDFASQRSEIVYLSFAESNLAT